MDLAMRFVGVGHWFAGGPLLGPLAPPMPYPPASYAILWPFLGWLDLSSARWLWALTLLVALGWLTVIVVRGSGADSTLERLFLAVFVSSMYSTCITIGNGQLGVHILPALLSALLLMGRDRGSWGADLGTALLFAFSLVKPSIAAPFFWILLFRKRGARPAALVVVIYACLTFVAVSFREKGVLELLALWASRSGSTARNARYGYANVHQWMSGSGMGEWILYGSLLILVLLGAWVLRHRGGPLWPLMGVTAIVARMWSYHAQYDDILLLVPLVALFRIAKEGSRGEREAVVSGLLLLVLWGSALAPARLLMAPPPWGLAFRTGQAVVWTAVLLFLAAHLARSRARPTDS
jgi:hypothetical protein